jgi:flavin reductase (DIM6/NTAB) family NADH-FMN oxidoreductase RutF
VVTEDIAEKMNICATDFPPEMSEVEIARFTTAPSQVVKQPRPADAHAALECREYYNYRDWPHQDHLGACCCHLR